MRILVTGGTGFIGSALVPTLQRAGHDVLLWTRSQSRARTGQDARIETVPASGGLEAMTGALDGCDAIINLAGESIVGGRWTQARRAALRDSRIKTTALIVRALAGARPRPRAFVSGSAVGWYGDRGQTPLTEASPPGEGFLAELCQEWEGTAREAAAPGLRVVVTRIGVVLGRNGGALAPMMIPFRLGVGGRLGSGNQYMPWIHLQDLVSALLVAVEQPAFEGAVNCVAPDIVTNRQFTAALGRVLHRPAFMMVPAFALRIAMGDAASALLDSQRVHPAVLESHGFRFKFPSLDHALADIVGRTDP